MKKNIYIGCLSIIGLMNLYSCDAEWTEAKPLDIQKETTYDEKYYENLRAYKKSDHAICFGWYNAYNANTSPSSGKHFVGLPDSMDVVSLWGAVIPSNNPALVERNEYGEQYLPYAYEDMQFIRKKKGTKVVLCLFAHIGNDPNYPHNEEGLKKMADNMVERVYRNDLDGLDLDYEPGSDWNRGENFRFFIEYIGQKLGPKSGSGKLLIIDFFSEYPPMGVEPYCDYFVRQAYAQGFNKHNSGILQRYYDYAKSSFNCPPEKFVVTEQMGWYWMTGGVPFTESDGNKFDSQGNPLYSVVGMARWNPIQGRKGGFGGFYFEYEYNTKRPANASIGDIGTKSIPYFSLRQGIQEQNPAMY